MGESLEPVRIEPDFIVNDVVVNRTSCALETIVCLEEEIEFCGSFPLVDVDLFRRTLTIDSGDTPIDDRSRPRVSIYIRDLCIGREEPCVVPLPTDDDSQLRSIRFFGVSKVLE